MNINTQSLQSFLADRGIKTQNRLYVKNNKLHYADIGCGYRFAAKLGFGNASMSNVAKFIRKNQDTCFATPHEVSDYNNFIASYNNRQCVCWKKARAIKQIILPHAQPTLSSDESSKTSLYDESPKASSSDESSEVRISELQPALSKDEAHEAIKEHIATCKLLIQDESQHLELVKMCEELKKMVEEWSCDGGISKNEKQTFNALLDLKNQVRNSFFPIKTSPLKGSEALQISTHLSDEDKQRLRTSLKEMRTAVLKKYFNDRLKADAVQLDALKDRFQQHGSWAFQEGQFLQNQLDQWQKKLDKGKPIAIPKWYHCTTEAHVMDTILKTDILYMHKGAYPGAFVSNKPELYGYGNYCFMLSEYIEKTGTKQKKSPLYPNQSEFRGSIFYGNSPLVAPKTYTLANKQQNVVIWLGFQKGKETLNPDTRMGTEGIPMRRDEKIKCGNLKYYKDTTTAFIFHQYNDPALQKIGQDRRVQVITYAQAQALETLINATFFRTLPVDWENKIQCVVD